MPASLVANTSSAPPATLVTDVALTGPTAVYTMTRRAPLPYRLCGRPQPGRARRLRRPLNPGRIEGRPSRPRRASTAPIGSISTEASSWRAVSPSPPNRRTHLYALRSTCTDSGCFATATQLADDDPKRKSDPPVDLVLDYVDGHWQMALRRDDACTDSDIKGPSITAWILQPQPDGTLTGTSYVAMNPSPDCAVATSTPVTVTRQGDVDAGCFRRRSRQTGRPLAVRARRPHRPLQRDQRAARLLIETGVATHCRADHVRAQHRPVHDVQVLSRPTRKRW